MKSVSGEAVEGSDKGKGKNMRAGGSEEREKVPKKKSAREASKAEVFTEPVSVKEGITLLCFLPECTHHNVSCCCFCPVPSRPVPSCPVLSSVSLSLSRRKSACVKERPLRPQRAQSAQPRRRAELAEPPQTSAALAPAVTPPTVSVAASRAALARAVPKAAPSIRLGRLRCAKRTLCVRRLLVWLVGCVSVMLVWTKEGREVREGGWGEGGKEMGRAWAWVRACVGVCVCPRVPHADESQ